jgi:hypothetical protein
MALSSSIKKIGGEEVASPKEESYQCKRGFRWRRRQLQPARAHEDGIGPAGGVAGGGRVDQSGANCW